jgi:hypothetical protein
MIESTQMNNTLKPLPSCWQMTSSLRPGGWHTMVLNNGCLLEEGFGASQSEAEAMALRLIQSKIGET